MGMTGVLPDDLSPRCRRCGDRAQVLVDRPHRGEQAFCNIHLLGLGWLPPGSAARRIGDVDFSPPQAGGPPSVVQRRSAVHPSTGPADPAVMYYS